MEPQNHVSTSALVTHILYCDQKDRKQAQALDRLQQLEGEFEAFKKNNSHDINEEEYQMIETSFQKRIRREKDYWVFLSVSL